MMTAMRKRLWLIVTACFVAVVLFSSVSTAKEPVYEVYALKYATLPAFPTPLLSYGKGFGETLKDVPFYFWVIVGNGKKICVDTGYADDGWAKEHYGMVGYESPKEVLAKIDLKPEEITDVIISHIHWDHAGNVPAFPNAKIWIQAEELEFAAGRGVASKLASHYFRPKHVMDILKAHFAGRVNLVEGDQSMCPGISLYAAPRGHTYCPQFVVVDTKAGPVVVASDNSYLYDNIENGTPNGICISLLAMENGIKHMKSFVTDSKFVIPGHDPAVLTKFSQIAPGVVKIQ